MSSSQIYNCEEAKLAALIGLHTHNRASIDITQSFCLDMVPPFVFVFVENCLESAEEWARYLIVN